MARQLNMLSAGQVITTALHTEMQQSYLEYAMSVIVGRALPDVRDGLKPVHRRILYAMHELGLTPDRPYRKCARVVGDVLGKYHPHGDQAVYDALVRMVQDFSSRYPLLAGHGNFGSVDDDPPAAMRYTETRLAPISNEGMLSEIGEATVDFIGNFDNSQQEPTVLPAQLPVLLLNGSSGIAVGMATNIPPHNLGEIVDGLIALIDSPNLSDEKLLELIPGPDFPTGGEIVGTDGIREAYLTGRGSVPIRGVAQVEEIQTGRGKHRRTAIVVTELPYQVNKAAWIEKMADLVSQGKIDGISDIRDESDRDGIRVVIELRRDIHPQKILHQLYRQTALQTNFGVIMLALDNGRPRQLPLRELLQSFLNFREETLNRRYRYELEKAENRLEVLDGLLTALENLDAVIDILRNAPDGTTAKQTFRERFEFSDRQSDAILAMPLRRLMSTEQASLQQEFDELDARVEELQKLLGDRRELLKVLKKDLRALKKKFGDERRTRIITIPEPNGTGEELREERGEKREERGEKEDHSSPPAPHPSLFEEEAQEVVLEITQRGYVRRIALKTYQRSRSRMAEKPTLVLEEGDDFVQQTLFTTTQKTLVVLTRTGKAFPIIVNDIPSASGRNARGVPLLTLLPPSAQGDRNGIVHSFILPDELEEISLLLLSAEGRLKRLPLIEFSDLSGRGLVIMKFKETDQLIYARLVEPEEQLVLASSGGRLLRLAVNEDNLPIMSRAAQGIRGLRLRKQDRLVGCATVFEDEELLLITEEGYTKRLPVDELRLSGAGELGTQIRFATRTDTLAGVVTAIPGTEVVLLTSANRMSRLDMESAPLESKDGKGDRLFNLNPDEKITAVTEIVDDAAEEGE
ncbi:DNA topoisomerase (ATP-hydrolyzing) subunit A [Leptothermofonsia sichuanensis E412]|uniref:DNA topoisomerase (ATP-hydrolyzing) subunit A n=1 Tax=Leptothermofonsia sichuanensis TaxID=2917832 RepID=UPI001CA77E2C|nr:DNA topoisomerase (ATP-hydrolyzing) subunit A [Leptothermofonsia sichuanensis]QZZ22947.1 DNA topoisomerase (ATP-hydrolyzing) subunit A [Leptothermofonsia sichuanensis E412]